MSIAGLLFGGIIRLIGHMAEPFPPMVLEKSDKFVKLTLQNFNWKIIMLVFAGYVAEFSSSLPNRLFLVHVNFNYQNILQLKPEKTMSWQEIDEKATEAFHRGYSKFQKLKEYYHLVNANE